MNDRIALTDLLSIISADQLRAALDYAKEDARASLEEAIGRYLYEQEPDNDQYSRYAPASRQTPPPFPVETLPEPMRLLVVEGAAASDIDPAFVALPLIGIAGGLIGPKVEIELKSGWYETAQLWLAVVAQPGRGKTPGEQHARTGLESLQSEAYSSYEQAQEQYESNLAYWSSQPENQRGPKPAAPTMTSYYSADVTMEALAPILSDHHGLVILRDELVSWVRSCDAYRGGKGGDRQGWLSLWGGVPVKVDRKTSKPIYAKKPVVSVVGGIQPDMLPALAEEANRRDGFVERPLFSYPEDHVPGWTDAEISAATIRQVEQQMRRLGDLPVGDEPIRLTAAARGRWIEWYTGNSAAQAHVSGILGGIYAKLPIQLARLALILHVLRETSTNSTTSIGSEITPETLDDAIDLIEYFRAHAHRIVPFFGEAATPVPGLTVERRRILDFHRRHGPATSQQVADALDLPYKSVNNMQQKLVSLHLLYQPGYGSYDVATPSVPESTSGGSDGFDGTAQVLRDSISSTDSIGSDVGGCQECGGPTNAAGLCLQTNCTGYDPDATPF